MPLYEYKCSGCGEVFEALQKFSDEPLQRHAACGGRVERLISPPAFQFKGSGWYVTDYARRGGGNGKSKDSGAESKPAEAKAEPKSSDSAKSKH